MNLPKPRHTGARPPHRTGWHFLPVVLLVLLTLLAYANAWPNSLAMDDVEFAVSDRFLALGLFDIAQFFREDL